MSPGDLTPWQRPTDSPLEVLRPAVDLWAASYDAATRMALVWAQWWVDVATYSNQKSQMIRSNQARHDAGLPWWWW